MTDKAERYLFAPKVEQMATFTFENIYVTENIIVYSGGPLPTGRSSRNTLTINGNLRALKEVAIVPANFTDFGPNDLYFQGNVYVAGDAIAEQFHLFSDDLPK